MPLKVAAAAAADTKGTTSILRYATIGKQLGFAGFLALDTTTMLDAAGIKKWDNAIKFQREAFRFWAIGILFSIVEQLYTLRRLSMLDARSNRGDGEGAVESKRISL